MNKNASELSFHPINITFKEVKFEQTHVNLATDFVKVILAPENLIKFLFSEPEKRFISSKLTKSTISQKHINELVSKFQTNKENTLAELNFIILHNDPKITIPMFVEAHIHDRVISWIDECENLIEKSLLLNIFCVCTKYLSLEAIHKVIGSLLKSPIEIAKKHLFVISYFLINRTKLADDSIMEHTMIPFTKLTKQNPKPNLNYLGFEETPKSIQIMNELHKKYTRHQEFIDYINGQQMNENSNNKQAREFLLMTCDSYPQLSEYLYKMLIQISRFLARNPKIENIFPQDKPDYDNNYECDITTIITWTSLLLIQQHLSSSNYFDAEIFNHFLVKHHYISHLLRCVKTVEEELFETEKDFNINEASLSIAIQVVTNILHNNPDRIADSINEDNLEDLVLRIKEWKYSSIKACFAKLVAVSTYWSQKQQRGLLPAEANPVLVSFVYLYLEQFEFYQIYLCDKGSVPKILENETFNQNLLEYSKKIGLSIESIW